MLTPTVEHNYIVSNITEVYNDMFRPYMLTYLTPYICTVQNTTGMTHIGIRPSEDIYI